MNFHHIFVLLLGPAAAYLLAYVSAGLYYGYHEGRNPYRFFAWGNYAQIAKTIGLYAAVASFIAELFFGPAVGAMCGAVAAHIIFRFADVFDAVADGVEMLIRLAKRVWANGLEALFAVAFRLGSRRYTAELRDRVLLGSLWSQLDLLSRANDNENTNEDREAA